MTFPVTTVPPQEVGSKSTDCDPRALGFELLHALSQPLTALCCSLELALGQNLTPEKCRGILSRSLAQAERASWLTMAIRELFDAGQPGENCEVLDLRPEIVRAIGDMGLVADAAGVKIVWPAGEAAVGEIRSGEIWFSEIWFDELRLHRALFNLLGFAVGRCGQGGFVTLELGESGNELRLRLMLSSPDAKPVDLHTSHPLDHDQPDALAKRLGLGIACATFQAAGGSLRVEDKVDGTNIEICLPQAGAGQRIAK